MGVPIVTMNNGGMTELVEDGKTGVLVKIPTPEAVAEAVEKCISDEEYYKTLKSNCEMMSANILDVKEYCHILIGKYNDLIDKKR